MTLGTGLTRVTTLERQATTAAGDTAYAYDAAGRVGSVTAPGGVGLAYAYDGDGLIVVRPISQEAVK